MFSTVASDISTLSPDATQTNIHIPSLTPVSPVDDIQSNIPIASSDTTADGAADTADTAPPNTDDTATPDPDAATTASFESPSMLCGLEGPNRGYVRYPYEDPQADSFVPVWATPEPHDCTFKDVVAWRRGAMAGNTLGRLVNPISPYFLAGPGGAEFAEGIRTLAKRIRWEAYIQDNGKEKLRAPSSPITHQEFYDILVRMRDAIGDTDRPTEEEETIARQEWKRREEIQAANFEERLVIKKTEKKHAEGPSTRGSKRFRDFEPISNSQNSASKRRTISHLSS